MARSLRAQYVKYYGQKVWLLLPTLPLSAHVHERWSNYIIMRQWHSGKRGDEWFLDPGPVLQWLAISQLKRSTKYQISTIHSKIISFGYEAEVLIFTHYIFIIAYISAPARRTPFARRGICAHVQSQEYNLSVYLSLYLSIISEQE